MKESLTSPISEERREIPGRLRIGVDIDGCVTNTHLWSCRLVKRGLKVDVVRKMDEERAVSYWFEQWPEFRKNPRSAVFLRQMYVNPFIYAQAPPLPGSIETLNKWRRQGHSIWFITARPRDLLEETTFSWFKKNSLGWASEEGKILFPDEEERVSFKAGKAQQLNLHVFVEDHAQTIRLIDSPSMMVRMVPKFPWNVGEDVGGRMTRFAGDWHHLETIWQEIDKVVQTASFCHSLIYSPNVAQ